jgi:hypothetical protein
VAHFKPKEDSMLGKILNFNDPRRIEITSYPRWKCWAFVTPLPLLAIAVGWLLVIISFIFQFEEASSGSLLVCAAVISEVLYERSRFRKWPRIENYSYNGFALTESHCNTLSLEGDKIVMPVGPKTTNRYIKSLLRLSKEGEWQMAGSVNGRDLDGTFWNYSYAIQRVENAFTCIILVSAVIGTLIWGYYDYFSRLYS